MTSDPHDPDRTDHRALLALATDLGRRAAALLQGAVTSERTSVQSKSTATDMVTEMDKAAERLIVEGIESARPDDGILGEEGTDRAGTSGYRWIIDPLDGTTNYIYAHPGYAVSIAIEHASTEMHDRRTIVGVVVDPVHGELFSAVAGAGATRNGMPIACSTETDLAQALVATGFGYDRARRERQAQVLVAVIPHVRDIRRMGSAAVDLCSVACGRVDAYFEKGLAPWDHAAGALIAAEAGALVRNVDGGGDLSSFVIAAPPALFSPLRERLDAARADDC